MIEIPSVPDEVRKTRLFLLLFFAIQVALQVLLMLTLTSLNSKAVAGLPPISYITAADVWSFACMILVFAAMVETIVESYIISKSNSKSETAKLLTFTHEMGDKPFQAFFPRVSGPIEQ